AKLRTSMHEREALGRRAKLERPVERGIAAAEDHELFAREIGFALHLVVNVLALEGLAAFDAETPRLKRPETAGNDHGLGDERRAGGSLEVQAMIVTASEPRDFLAEMKLRVERLDLLQQPIDQLLRAAHR